jgi:hypothetical protein
MPPLTFAREAECLNVLKYKFLRDFTCLSLYIFMARCLCTEETLYSNVLRSVARREFSSSSSLKRNILDVDCKELEPTEYEIGRPTRSLDEVQESVQRNKQEQKNNMKVCSAQ